MEPMHTVIHSFVLIIILATGYLAFVFFVETKHYGDTIVYESRDENTLIAPKATEEMIATTTSSATTTPTQNDDDESAISEFEEVVVPASPPVEEQMIVAEEIAEETTVVEETNEIQNEEESAGIFSFSEINEFARPAIVNILCLTKGPHQYITPISGSGTIISESGIILTNAHIAQFYLFEDFPTQNFVDCQIRTGSPAKVAYRAKLLYIPPQWVEENAEAIATENPMGTGEDDYAFLLITESLTNAPLPKSFQHVGFDTGEQIVARGESLLVGAYPAGFLGGRTIQQDLYASTAIIETGELYTFDDTLELDLISLGGSVVAQQGASGGPVINKEGRVVALISTSSDGETTDERDLRAITLEHIERSLMENNKTTLEELLSGDLKTKATVFNDTAAPLLLQILLNGF